jgi:hypothetical protein
MVFMYGDIMANCKRIILAFALLLTSACSAPESQADPQPDDQETAVPASPTPEVKEPEYTFTYKESSFDGEFDAMFAENGRIYGIVRDSAYLKAMAGLISVHDIPYRNVQMSKTMQFIEWNPEDDTFNVLADLSEYDIAGTNWVSANGKYYFVRMGLNDERYFNTEYDHGWCAPYDIVCYKDGEITVLDECIGMTGGTDVPNVYKYNGKIYYLGSVTEGIHRTYQLKKLDPASDTIEILDTIEYDAESTEEDVIDVRKVCGLAHMVGNLFSYVEHSDDRQSSIIHEYDADTGAFKEYTIPRYVEDVLSLDRYLFMTTTQFDDENHTSRYTVETYQKETGNISGLPPESYQKFAADGDEAVVYDVHSVTKSKPFSHFIDNGGQFGMLNDRTWLENTKVPDYWEKYRSTAQLLMEDNTIYIVMGGTAITSTDLVLVKAEQK